MFSPLLLEGFLLDIISDQCLAKIHVGFSFTFTEGCLLDLPRFPLANGGTIREIIIDTDRECN